MSDPKQTEIAGADDFNLASEVVQGWTPPPAPPDDQTLDLPL